MPSRYLAGMAAIIAVGVALCSYFHAPKWGLLPFAAIALYVLCKAPQKNFGG